MKTFDRYSILQNEWQKLELQCSQILDFTLVNAGIMQISANQIMIFGGKRVTDHQNSTRSSVIYIFDTETKSMTTSDNILPNGYEFP